MTTCFARSTVAAWILRGLCWSVLTLGINVGASAEEPAAEKLPAGAAVTALEARPAMIELKHRFDYAQIVITAVLNNGERVDATRIATRTAPEGVVTVSATGLVRPKADGGGEVKFTLGEKSVVVPVKATGQQAPREVSFVQDVMPVLGKMGCNAGTCHGALNGKNGFKLSLRGYDPLYDHQALTDDLAARRINRAAPEQSLMLLKPAGEAPHVGGVLTRPGEPYYELIKAWIATGVKFDPTKPRVVKVEVFPQNPTIPLPGMKQQSAVLATYSDGMVRDVSAEAFIESGNTEVLELDKFGLATAIRRGEAAILARYEGAYAATTVTVMGDRAGFEWTPAPENNYIDGLVHKKLQKVKVLPSPTCTDAEFFRRVTLDLTGLPPTVDELRAFLADPRDSKTKRDAAIDRLIGGPEFIEFWTNRWADFLQCNRKFLGEEGAYALRNWIRQAVASNMPYDQFCRAVLTASGSNLDNPPASFFKSTREADALMENTTQLFLAVRFSCNKCHDHPFERWTQDQHWQLASYFAQVGRKEDPKSAGKKIGGTDVEQPRPLFEIIYDAGAGEVKHSRTGQNAAPAFPYQHGDMPPATLSRREQLAHWVASPKNEYFAKSYVNRVWSYLLGVGLIEPVDDIRAGNPPTNPELLERLTAEFINSGFNVQELIRVICRSQAYQRSLATNKWNEDDGVNYSHAIARRLPAETLYDAVHSVTGSVARLPGMPAGMRASETPDSGVRLNDGFLELFGRPVRESVCECERSGGVMLGQALNLINGPTVANAIADPDNRIAKLVASEPDDGKLIEELFLSILCRGPNEQEKAAGLTALRAFDEEHARLTAALGEYEKTLPAKQAEWEKSQGPIVWTELEMVSAQSAVGATFEKQADKSVLVGGKQGKDTYTVRYDTPLVGITGIRLEMLADDRLPAKGPGRAPNGNLVLNEFKLAVAPAAEPAKSANVTFQNARADFSQQGFDVGGAIDGSTGTGWALMGNKGTVSRSHVATLETAHDIGHAAGSILTFTLDQQHPDGLHSIGKFRISATTARRPIDTRALPAPVAAALALAADKRNDEQRKVLADYFRSLDAEYQALARQVAAHAQLAANKRLYGAQDLAWALLNSPAFLFNH